jgi:hypothetical protein
VGKFCATLISFLLLGIPLFAECPKHTFVGTILAPSAVTLDPKHPSLGVSYFDSKIYGAYDNSGKLVELPVTDSQGPFFSIMMGFNERFGGQILGAYNTNSINGTRFSHCGDTTARLGMQIARDDPHSWVPDFNVIVQEIFPTGNFNDLDFEGNTADRTGTGSFQTGFHLAFQKKTRLRNGHYFLVRGSGGYFIPSRVAVDGINHFGGALDTRGKAFPGNWATFYATAEYALTFRWGILLDTNLIIGESGDYIRFEGTDVQLPSYYQFSVAPALEYTLNEHFAFLGGTWFTVCGKNSPAFFLTYLAVIYTY